MKILITGGCGYIARNLNRLLSAKGYEILAPSRKELDMLSLPSLQDCLKKEKVDAIIHCASRGGMRKNCDTFEDVYLSNIKMFENLMLAAGDVIPIILFGSGSEYDRRYNISNRREGDVYSEWPVDFYGLSKNIITRRIKTNMRVLRLFGCFNYDEDPSRFIKYSIHRVKQGLPILIDQNRIMDFFFFDDIIPVLEYVLKNKYLQNINLVYNKKRSLFSIAKFIQEYCKSYSGIDVVNIGMDNAYTGNGDILENLNLPLIGLDEGIERTIKHLL